MEAKAHYALVGIVIILLTVSLVSAVLWLGARGRGADISQYTIYFKDQTLDGLQVDSTVTMKGIKIGSVKSFEISPRNIEQVKVLLEVDESAPVKHDTKAVIRRNLLTGLAYVDLEGGSQGSQPLVEVLEGEEYPVIPEGRSEFTAIAQSVPNLMEKGGVLFDNVGAFFSEENYKLVNETLVNLSKVSNALGHNEKKIEAFLNNASDLVTDLRRVTDSLDKAAAGGRFVRISEDLEATLSNTKRVSGALDSQVSQMVTTFKSSAEAIVKQTGTLAANLSRAAENFAAALERFEEPRSAILGPNQGALGPGEVVKSPK